MLDRLRLLRAKRRYMRPHGPPPLALVVLMAMLLASAVLAITLFEGRRDSRADAITAYADSARVDPLDAIASAARSHRYILLGDVAAAAASKHFAAQVIGRLARTTGLDIVGLDASIQMQEAIDRYLDSPQQDATPLLADPNPAHSTAAYLAVYQSVWTINREIPADRRIRIVALGPAIWPPARAASPARLLTEFEQRQELLVQAIDERIIQREPRASVLLFVDGLNVLRANVRLETGSAAAAESALLGARLNATQRTRVYSVLVDAPATEGVALAEPYYTPGVLFQLTRTSAAHKPLAFPLTHALPATLQDLDAGAQPGLSIRITPPTAPLATAADLYVRLEGT